MKNLKVLFAAAFIAISAPAFAQFANSGSSSSSTDTEDYNRVSITYNNIDLSPDGGDGFGLNGVGVDYIHGFSLSSELPLFIETGAKFTAAFHSESLDDGYEDFDMKYTFMSLAVPVNVAYKFAIGEDMSIQPYAGLNFKFNVVGKIKASYDGDSESWSVFDKDDMDELEMGDTWKRFQLGWHIGAGLNYKQFYVGLSYGTDFIKIAKKTNTGTFAVGVGYNF